MSIIQELKRRNVFRVGIAYAIAAWLLLQLTDVLIDLLGLAEITGKYVILLILIGFIPALIFAWAFEMTPEGLKREKDVDRTQSITPHTGRKLDFVIIGVLVIALGYFVADKFLLSSAPAPESTSQAAESSEPEQKALETIAVLPFVDMSPDGDNEYFSDGLTEELLNILAQIKELQVAGRTSSFAFKDQNEDLRSIGEKLGVKTILEGSVRKDQAGQKVRITAQLVNVENGFHLWSETYDRDLKDIFAIQDEIAHEVAAALRITLLGEDEQRLATRATTELSAYEMYLQGLQQLNGSSYSSLRSAEELFSNSVELDPAYTPARIGQTRAMLELVGTGALSRQEYIDRATPVLKDILAADPNNADALVLNASVYAFQDDPEELFLELDRALVADPRNTEALQGMGNFVFFDGDTDKGLQYLHEAERLDPYSTSVMWDLCSRYGFLMQPEKATPYCERIGTIQPDNPQQYYGLAMASRNVGNLGASQVWDIKAVQIDPEDHELPAQLATVWLDLGDMEQAEIWLQKAEEISADKTGSVAARIMLMHYREQTGLAGDLARRALLNGLDRRPGTLNTIEQMYLINVVAKGRIDEALEYYRGKTPRAFETPLSISKTGFPGTGDLIEIAYLLIQQNPDSTQAKALLEIAEGRLTSGDGKAFPWFLTSLKAKIAATKGEREKALGLLEQAFDQGLRDSWRSLVQLPVMYDNLRDDPRYLDLIAKLEAEMELQRVEAHRLIAEEFGP
jgi:TolB-like protein/Tfp pilus assembly protein PilF